MAAEANAVEQVYDYICQYVTDNQALPSASIVSAALGLDQVDLSACITHLRSEGRIASVILLPTVYADWWREYASAHWSYKAMRLS